MTATMKHKIKVLNKFHFFSQYHCKDYILYHDCRKIVVLKDKKENSTYKLANDSQKELVVYKIDSGIIEDNNIPKCDYGIYSENDTLFLIELKGKDLEHAIDQISCTINTLITQPNITISQVNARIVLSKVSTPDIHTTKEKKLQQLLKNKFGNGTYKKKSRELEEHL